MMKKAQVNSWARKQKNAHWRARVSTFCLLSQGIGLVVQSEECENSLDRVTHNTSQIIKWWSFYWMFANERGTSIISNSLRLSRFRYPPSQNPHGCTAMPWLEQITFRVGKISNNPNFALSLVSLIDEKECRRKTIVLDSLQWSNMKHARIDLRNTHDKSVLTSVKQ